MRRGDGANAVGRRLIVEQHVAAAVHLQVDEAGREPEAIRQVMRRHRRRQVGARHQRDDAGALDHDRGVALHDAAVKYVAGGDGVLFWRAHRVRVTFCR